VILTSLLFPAIGDRNRSDRFTDRWY